MGDKETKKPGSFLDTILGLFAKSGDPDSDKKRYLKQTAKELAKGRFKFYKISSDEILPALPKFFYEMYKAVYPAQTMFHGMQNQSAWKMLAINSAMNDQTLEMADSFTETAIIELSKTMQFNELHEKIKADLETFLAVFNSDTCILIDELYTKLMRFRDFCCYDFYLMLKKFDTGVKEGEFSYTPKFESLNGEYAAENLKEFASVGWPLLSLSDWQDMFAVLKKSRGVDVISPNVWGKIVSRVEALKRSSVFEMMIQLTTKDPFYQMDVDDKPEHVIDAYIDKIKDEVDKTFGKIQGEQKTNKIGNLVTQVFGNAVEDRLKNYTDVACQPYAKKNLGTYAFCQPLSYLKNFLLDYVKKDIREFADLVLIRGKWANQSLAAPMSNSYHVLIDLASKVVALDESLDENAAVGNKLKTLIVRVDRDRAANDIVKNIIKELITQA
jgi:hypothetical protein